MGRAPAESAESATLGPMLTPTSPAALIDQRGRPYFLWDCDLDLEQFRERLREPDLDVRAYFLAKLMRQAKPDDVFQFVRLADIRGLWPGLAGYLGHSRPFWTWILETWTHQVDGDR